MTMLLRDVSIRGTQSQDRVVGTPLDRKAQLLKLLRRFWMPAAGALLLLLAIAWSASAWLSSEKTIARERLRTGVVARGPFIRDVAATGTVVAAVSPTLFAEAPGIIIYKVRAGDTVKPGDVLGEVESAALTNEYERERATLASVEAALNRQTIEVRRQILKSSQDSDLAKVQITAAEREFKRAEEAWGIHVIPERDFKRAQDDLETAKLNYAHAIQTGGLEKDSLEMELRAQRATREAQAL
jgi:HlyD family secretion protein